MYKGKRIRNIFDPRSVESFSLSRSKLEDFLRCPRCFYLDRRLGVGRPDMPAFTLNSAVDALLKKEFDIHRAKGEPHPLMRQYGIEAVPLDHPMMDEWRENFKGVRFYHKPTNFVITGAVDDIWVDAEGRLIVVDYKATSTEREISMDSEYRLAYKRQMEIYQWLLRQNGFQVNDVGYFVYCNGRKDVAAFDGKLEFEVQVIAHQGDSSWVEETILMAHKCMSANEIPAASDTCDFCAYRATVNEVLR